MRLAALALATLLILTALVVVSQPIPGVLWRRGYGGSLSEEFWSALPGDEKVFLVGRTASFGNGGYDALVAVLDLQGDLEILSTMGWTANDAFYSASGDPESSVIAVGEIDDGSSVGWAVEMSSNTGVLWARELSGGDSLYLMDVLYEGDTAVAVGAIEEDDNWDALIVALDSQGNLLWSESLGGGDWEELRAVAKVGNVLYAVGTTSSYGSGPSDGLVIEFDWSGNVLGAWTVGGSGSDWLLDCASLGDGLVVVGGTNTPSGSTYYPLVAILSSTTQAAYLDFGMPAELYGVSVDAEGHIWVSGQGVDDQDLQGVLAKLDQGLTPLWGATYGGSGEEGLRGIAFSPGGAMFVAGFSTTPSSDLQTVSITSNALYLETRSVDLQPVDAGVQASSSVVYRTDPNPTDEEAGVMKVADDQSPPEVQITQPQDGEVVGEAAITASWAGQDNEGIERYDVYLDGELVYSGTSTTVQIQLGGSGQHSLRVVAYDGAGNTGSDECTFLADLESPWVNITSPLEGEEVQNPVTVSWEGGDDCGVDHYEVKVDDGEWTNVGVNESVQLVLQPGNHTVYVRVYDLYGRCSEDSVNFTVSAGIEEFPL